MKRIGLVLTTTLALTLHGLDAGAQVTKADYQRVDTLATINSLFYNKAVRPTWIGSTTSFWYLNHERKGDIFYLVDAQKQQKHPAFNADTLAAKLAMATSAKVNPAKLPFTQIAFDENLLSFTFDYNNQRWRFTASGNKLEKETTSDAKESVKAEKVTSPDGEWQAYIRDFNLYAYHLKDKKEYRLSFDGVAGNYYSSELLWSPDSKKIATAKVMDVPTRKIPLLESAPVGQLQPAIKWIEYAKPGDALPQYSPALFDVAAHKQLHVNSEGYQNQFWLNITGWRKDSRAFTFEYNQRGHQLYQICEVDATTGLVRNLVSEQSNTFIEYYKNFRYDVNDGQSMVWLSERDGWKHIYLIDGKSGKAKQVTKGEWVVREVVHVDEASQTVVFKASGMNKGEDPYNNHYYRIKLDGSGLAALTPEEANHTATFSKDYSFMVDTYSRPDMAPTSQLKQVADAKPLLVLEKGDVDDVYKRGWQLPEVFNAKGRDGKTDIWGTIIRPSTFDKNKAYPIVEMIYAGPHDSHVPKDFMVYHHLCSRLADLGFIVVLIDGMGTGNRSKAFHDVCYKNLKDAGFPDRIAWIKAAASKYPYMDTTRVGIYGWSAGGQNALAALLFQNNFYKVAVSLCGCHDNRMDKIWWNEQWMGYPIDESYSECSNVDNAWRLKGKLLIINGELDDNVDPASTLQVVSALIKANKNFEQLYLPGFTHSLGAPFVMHKIHDFFVKNLMNQQPPEW